jgi:hypothetical protein
VAVKVSCPAGSPADCSGSLVVRTASVVRVAGRKTVLRLGSARYDIAAGRAETVKVKLARGVQRLANRKGRLAVRAIASTGPAGQAVSSTRRLTLAIGTTARKH